jgi:drug/metabolite transporter (DMT)-like permease
VNASSIALLTFSAATAAAGQVLFKLGADNRHHAAEFLNSYIAGGLLAYGIGTVIWIYVLSSERLANVFAFTSLTFALVLVADGLVEGTALSRTGFLGIALILAGLYLITGPGTGRP